MNSTQGRARAAEPTRGAPVVTPVVDLSNLSHKLYGHHHPYVAGAHA